MLRLVIVARGALFFPLPAVTQVHPFPAGFRTQEVSTNHTVLHVRTGGEGPAAVVLHGYGETGDM
jgi:pimeloyl-ACP methyl ester carboxylesterase